MKNSITLIYQYPHQVSMEDTIRDFTDISNALNFSVNPKKDEVAFFWNPDDRFELFQYDFTEGSVSRLTDRTPQDPEPGDILWGRDGETLFFIEESNGKYYISFTDLENSFTRLHRVTRDTVIVDCTEERLYFLEGFRSEESDLKWINLETSEVSRFEYYDFSVISGGIISPEEDRIAYTSKISEEEFEIVISNLDGENRFFPEVGEGMVYVQDWSRCGSYLLIGSGSNKHGWRFGVYNLEREEMNWIGDYRPVALLEDNKILTGGEKPKLFDKDGSYTELSVDHSVSFDPVNSNDVLTDKGFVFTSRTVSRSSELYHYNFESEKTKRLVESVKDLSEVEPVEVEWSFGDKERKGYLYRSKGKAPVIVWLYGARDNGSSLLSVRMKQMLCHLGYHVFEPIYPGEVFREEEHKCFAEAGKWVKQQDWAEKDRLGMYGHSHGGYNVMMQLVKYPDVWNCGVASCGIYDLVKSHEDGDATSHMYWNLGDIEDNKQKWVDQSPVNYLEEISNPFLVIYGSEDSISNTQSSCLDQKLIESGFEKGKDYDFEVLEGSGHFSFDKDEKYQKWIRIVRFFEENL